MTGHSQEELKINESRSSQRRRALCCLMLYVSCLAMIFSGLPVPNFLSAIIAVAAAFWCIRQSRSVPKREEPKVSGFLILLGIVAIAHLLLTMEMAKSVAESIYAIVFGATSHDLVWIALGLLVTFPLFALGTVGLTYLAGTFLENVLRRRDETEKRDGENPSPS